MTVVIDIGNSRIKWARVREAELEDIGAADIDASPDDVLASLDRALGGPLERVVATNVAGEAFSKALEAFASDRDAPLTIIRPSPSSYGVRCGYADPSRLGADRWVAVIAAHRLIGGSVAVIDVGTTVTLDVVTRDGRHLGGLIMAGPALAAATLGRETRGIGETPPAEFATRGLAILGTDTNAAVAHGTMLGLAAGLDRAVAEVAEALAEPLEVVLTGGAAHRLEPWLQTAVSYRRHFVLEGLAELAAIG